MALSDVSFVRTHVPYDSHNDLYNLATLSGYPVVHTADVDPYDASKCYIFGKINSEWDNGYGGVKARLIWYNLEWTDNRPAPAGFAEQWHMDAGFAKRNSLRYVPVGSHPLLRAAQGDCERIYDVSFLSYFTHRRELIRDGLKQRGLTIAPQGWGMQRHDVLSKSRLMLHVHQSDEGRGIAGLRWAIAAAYKLPLISETVDDLGIFSAWDFLQADYENISLKLANTIHLLALSEYTDTLYNKLCVENTFRAIVDRSL